MDGIARFRARLYERRRSPHTSGLMIFLSYEFVVFAALFYLLYYFIRLPSLRLFAIVAASLLFQGLFGGWASFIPISILTLLTFLAGRSGNRSAIAAAIALCAATLAFYKYTFFVTDSVIGGIHPQTGADLHALLKQFVPAVIPLGISFFVFEFVHYLVDVRSGTKPISKPSEFMAFALFWPTMVAGPIKRYQQFVPSLGAGLQGPSGNDAMIGLCRIAVGCAKKWAADNLTAWIEYTQNSFAELPIEARWLLLAGISFRILLDFSGYSDMAIGYARMMGIVVENSAPAMSLKGH